MKISLSDRRQLADQSYAQAVCLELDQIKREKLVPSKGQELSTQRLLGLTDKDLEAYLNRPLPTKEQAQVEIKERPISPMEYEIETKKRKKQKNTIGEFKGKAHTEDTFERAVQAFRYTPPAKLTPTQIERLHTLNLITEFQGPPPEAKVEWKPLTLWQAIIHWFKGGQVKVEEKRVTWRDT